MTIETSTRCHTRAPTSDAAVAYRRREKALQAYPILLIAKFCAYSRSTFFMYIQIASDVVLFKGDFCLQIDSKKTVINL